MRIRVGFLLLALVLPLGVAVTRPDSASADPWGPGAGTSVELWQNQYSRLTDIDGMYTWLNTPADMDVPLQGTQGQPSVYPNGHTIVGHNTRPMQIVAVHNSAARDAGEFVAIGIQAGCSDDEREDDRECTGIHSNGGVYKRVYVEHRVKRFAGDPREYEIEHYNALSVSTNHQYQVQRKGYLGGFYFRFYFDNSNKQNVPVDDMVSGFGVFGTESVTEVETDCCNAGHQLLNQHVDDFSSIKYHRFGEPSASPPGTTNYTAYNWHLISNPHASHCSIQFSGSGFVVSYGERC